MRKQMATPTAGVAPRSLKLLNENGRLEMRNKRQRAIITLTDQDDGTFKAHVFYEPSVIKRQTQSPCVNAALRLSIIITKTGQPLGMPFAENEGKIIENETLVRDNKEGD